MVVVVIRAPPLLLFLCKSLLLLLLLIWMMVVLVVEPKEGVVGTSRVPGTGIGAEIVLDSNIFFFFFLVSCFCGCFVVVCWCAVVVAYQLPLLVCGVQEMERVERERERKKEGERKNGTLLLGLSLLIECEVGGVDVEFLIAGVSLFFFVSDFGLCCEKKRVGGEMVVNFVCVVEIDSVE